MGLPLQRETSKFSVESQPPSDQGGSIIIVIPKVSTEEVVMKVTPKTESDVDLVVFSNLNKPVVIYRTKKVLNLCREFQMMAQRVDYRNSLRPSLYHQV